MILKNFRLTVLALVLCVALGATVFFSPPTPAVAQSNSLAALKEDIDFLRSKAQAVLFFNIWGDNPAEGFKKHILTEAQFKQICPEPDCSDLGANYASRFVTGDYSKSRRVGMGWGLEIGEASNQAAIRAGINRGVQTNQNIIVRFGTAGSTKEGYDDSSGLGAKNPQALINLLSSIGNADPGITFYAILGPNEPDEETWAVDGPDESGNCGKWVEAQKANRTIDEWTSCVAPKLADYMKTVCAAKNANQIPPNVRLLSPAFNMTSATFQPLINKLIDAGAPLQAGGCLTGFAGNIYPHNETIQKIWQNQNIDSIISRLGGIPIYITETGPWEGTIPPDSVARREIKDLLGIKDEDISHEDNYISPLLGLAPKEAQDYNVIRESMVNQGYQAYCATPTYTIDPVFEGDIRRFLDNIRRGFHPPLDLPTGPVQIASYAEAQTPLFRDVERKRTLKADLEEYFGYKELEEDSFARAEVKSAPINSLLSETQRCAQAAATLIAQEDMCNKLIDPSQCSLLNRQVPGTSLRVRQLLGEYKSFAAGSTDHLENCKNIVVGRGGMPLRTGMLTASLHLDRAYRIAYLVGAVAQKPKVPNRIFNFFSHSETAEPLHEALIFAFKIPDIGTNKGSVWQSEAAVTADGRPLGYDQVKRDAEGKRVPEIESGHTYWDDPMTLTRNVLIPRRMAETLDLDGSRERRELLGAVAGANASGPLVNCLIGAPPNGTGAPSCNDHVGFSVVSIINGTAIHDPDRVNCSLIKSEEAQEIGDPAKLGPDSFQNLFQMKYGDKILENIWQINGTSQPFSSIFQFRSDTIWPPEGCAPGAQGQPAGGDCTVINFYLVYPMGYDLETLQTVMAQSFLTPKQFEAIEAASDIKDRFNVFDDQVELEGDEQSHDYIDRINCPRDPITGIEICPEKTISVDVESSQGPAQFFGARLGFWTHRIQQIFNRRESLAHKYLRRCATTEEFLLDQCGGPTVDAVFNEPLMCEHSKHKTLKGITNKDTERFTFFYEAQNMYGAGWQPNTQVSIPDEEGRKIFFGEGGGQPTRCNLKLTARFIDSLTLIQSGGGSIIASNPGNVLGCTGTYSASRRVQIRRLDPVGPLPAWNDPRWNTAPVMATKGSSAAQIDYDLRLTPGYYWINHNIAPNAICITPDAYVVRDGQELSFNTGYVIDFSEAQCNEPFCMSVNLQSAMEGGGEVYGPDGEVIRTIDSIREWDNCPLVKADGSPFTYQTIAYNNACGGGRGGDCTDEGGCGFWSSYINKLNNGEGSAMEQKGYALYFEIFGRTLKGPRNFEYTRCTHSRMSSSGQLRTPIFPGTLHIQSCDNYSPNMDSLKLFGKQLGSPSFLFWNGGNYTFTTPSKELWGAINAAAEKHSCDPFLELAVAASESPVYTNHTVPNQAQALGVFQFIPTTWDLWAQPQNLPDGHCQKIQPPTFTPENRAGLDFSSPTLIPAAADSACRMILWTGMQKYYDDEVGFVRAFSQQGDNPHGQVWNPHAGQARFVWNLWRWLVESMETQPVPQPPGQPVCDRNP